jgi:hypothetical protein
VDDAVSSSAGVMCAKLHAMAKQTGVTNAAINESDDSVKTIADSTSEQGRLIQLPVSALN